MERKEEGLEKGPGLILPHKPVAGTTQESSAGLLFSSLCIALQ